MNLPGHDDYRRPSFSRERIHRGVDLCRAAVVRAKAIREGVDPDEAADIAEGEAVAQRAIREKPCRHCKAHSGRPCVRLGTDEPLSGFHSCRTGDYLASLEAA